MPNTDRKDIEDSPICVQLIILTINTVTSNLKRFSFMFSDNKIELLKDIEV